ncbi:MAG: glycosyltransferase family 4 protein [Chloroflexota bacterium]
MPKNVLFTSWYTGLGGGETDLLSIAQFLDPSQWTPHLLLPSEGTLADRWRSQGWQVHITHYRGASTYFIPSIWARFPVVERMAKIIRNNDIALISSEYHTLPMIHAAAQKTQTHIMWTVHGWWFKPHVWQKSFFREIPIVARSHSIRDGFLGTPPFISPEKVPVIYSGVDTERFRPNGDARQSERYKLGLDDDALLVGMVARFQEVKGHHIFQAMAEHILRQMPDLHFVIAGEDTFGVAKDEHYRQQVLDYAQTHPVLRERLHYIGFRDDVENVLTSADVVVCASEFESYGKVNIEAMACGTPVVSTNRGGPSETIHDGETGYLVPPNQPQSLADKVMLLLSDVTLRRKLGERAREHVMKNFSASQTAQAYQHIFNKLVT